GGGQGTVSYVLHNHQASTSRVLNSSGGVIAAQRYWPYGRPRTEVVGDPGITQTDKLFTGQQMEANDDGLFLDYYHARFYSAKIGRFLSVDPVVGNPSKPQSWNPYTYAANSPVRYTDPSGKCLPDMDGPGGCGIRPAAGEDATGRSFVHAPTCDD